MESRAGISSRGSGRGSEEDFAGGEGEAGCGHNAVGGGLFKVDLRFGAAVHKVTDNLMCEIVSENNQGTISDSLDTVISMCSSRSILKKVVSKELNSWRSMVSSPLTSSRLKRSSTSSTVGVYPPTRLMMEESTSGNSDLVKRWLLSWSNSLNILSSMLGMSSSLKLRDFLFNVEESPL